MTETTDVAATTEPISNITSFIAEDGSFKEGWRNFVPEDIRNEKVFDRTKNIEGVFKSLASAERKFGMKAVPLPGENAKPEEMDEFYKTLGRLDKPEDYKIEKDASIPDEFWPDEIVNILQKSAFEAGNNPKQAAIYTKNFNEFLKKQAETIQINQKLEYDKSINDLKTEWSNNYDSNIHIGNIALEKGTAGDSKLKETIKEKFGHDPDFARLMRNLGVNFKESKIIDADAVKPDGAAEIDKKIEALRNSDAYKDNMNPNYKQANEEMVKLYAMTKKISQGQL